MRDKSIFWALLPSWPLFHFYLFIVLVVTLVYVVGQTGGGGGGGGTTIGYLFFFFLGGLKKHAILLAYGVRDIIDGLHR